MWPWGFPLSLLTVLPAARRASAILGQDYENKWICRHFVPSCGDCQHQVSSAGGRSHTWSFLLPAVPRSITVTVKTPVCLPGLSSGDPGEVGRGMLCARLAVPSLLRAGGGTCHERAPVPCASPVCTLGIPCPHPLCALCAPCALGIPCVHPACTLRALCKPCMAPVQALRLGHPLLALLLHPPCPPCLPSMPTSLQQGWGGRVWDTPPSLLPLQREPQPGAAGQEPGVNPDPPFRGEQPWAGVHPPMVPGGSPSVPGCVCPAEVVAWQARRHRGNLRWQTGQRCRGFGGWKGAWR